MSSHCVKCCFYTTLLLLRFISFIQTRCPSLVAPPHSSMPSLCSTMTTAPMLSSRNTATWWSKHAAATKPPSISVTDTDSLLSVTEGARLLSFEMLQKDHRDIYVEMTLWVQTLTGFQKDIHTHIRQ